MGFDHGAGHPLLLLCNAKAPNYGKNKAFNDLARYSECPKVAGAVIKAADRKTFKALHSIGYSTAPKITQILLGVYGMSAPAVRIFI